MTSMRRTLLLRLLAGGTLAVLAALAAIYFMAYSQANNLFDFQMERMGYSLRDRVISRLGDSGDADTLEEGRIFIQIWDKTGTQLYVSQDRLEMPVESRLGFANVATASGEWRTFGVQSANQTVQIAQPMSVRRDLAVKLALSMLIPVGLLIPVLGLLAWFTVGQGLAPLLALTGELRRRGPESHAALAVGRYPVELSPMVDALKDLLRRLELALQSQRDFVADAAHELRTPLAVIGLQAQNVELAANDHDRSRALAELRAGIDRAVHLVQQLLTLARQEPGAGPRAQDPTGLAQIAREVVAEFAQIATDKGVDLGLLKDDAVTVTGDSEGLRILMTNLVGNAIHYTPAGGRVDVSVSNASAGPVLEVLDTGPGIGEDERSRVFDRFYRTQGTGTAGSGLGLAIVKRIADAHGARVSLNAREDGQPGLRALVQFAAPAV